MSSLTFFIDKGAREHGADVGRGSAKSVADSDGSGVPETWVSGFGSAMEKCFFLPYLLIGKIMKKNLV